MNLFVKALTVIDASFLCHERGMVGESWILDVSLSGTLNEMSMVLDFGKVKSQIKRLVDQHVDHRLLVPQQSQHIHFFKTENEGTTLDLIRDEKSIHLNCPEEAYCFVNTQKITTESVQEHVYHILKNHLPDNVEGLEITLRPENIAGAYYHYSHGLKKHDGNCQRIAHGHRSPIELYVDGKRDEELEHSFAERWKDIYLGSAEDQVNLTSLSLSQYSNMAIENTHYGFSYDTPQGRFELAIAKCETEIIDSDTTIELLACYISKEIKKSLAPHQSLKVVAYEGVGKGAMAFNN